MVESETKTTVKTEAKSKAGRVKITVPRGDVRGDPNYFISVNGKNYLLPRGKTSEVPPEVAEEYYRSEKAKEKFYATSDALLEKAK